MSLDGHAHSRLGVPRLILDFDVPHERASTRSHASFLAPGVRKRKAKAAVAEVRQKSDDADQHYDDRGDPAERERAQGD
jgi:hypothetical protein